MKEAGNSLYLGGENTEAAAKYTEGLNVCPLCFTEDRAILYANRAAVHIKTVELNGGVENVTTYQCLLYYKTGLQPVSRPVELVHYLRGLGGCKVPLMPKLYRQLQ